MWLNKMENTIPPTTTPQTNWKQSKQMILWFSQNLFLIRVFYNLRQKHLREKTKKIQMGFSVLYSIMYITTIIT